MKYIVFFVLGFLLVGALTTPQSFAQDPDSIPDAGQRAKAFTDNVIPVWIKNNADWWASDTISDSDFLYGIKYLVESNIIEFQSDNIEQYILDWDTIVDDSLYAYEGSVRLQSEFFDYVNYTVEYNMATG